MAGVNPQPAKVQHAASLQQNAANQVDAHAVRVLQHTAQFLLPEVAKLIDDLQHQNFHIPTLLHQHRLVKPDANGQRFVAAQESDYVDAQEQFTYANPNFPLRNITSGDEQQRLEIAVATLKAALDGKTIGVAKLKRALTANEFAEYQVMLAQVAEQSETRTVGEPPVVGVSASVKPTFTLTFPFTS